MASGSVTIGKGFGASFSAYFKGLIRDVRVFERGFNDEEVMALLVR